MTEDDRKNLTKDDRIKIALTEYEEVVAQFRKLTDIRFQLLTYLPLGTVAAAVLVPAKEVLVRPVIPLFAFVVTICIAIYDKRNNQFYDELVKRAAELERDLEIEHGIFSDRPKAWLEYGPAWLKYGRILVDHRGPIGFIYMAAASLWACLYVDLLIKDEYWRRFLPVWLNWLKVFVPVVAFGCWKKLRRIEKGSKEKHWEAVELVMTQVLGPKVRTPDDTQQKLADKIVEQNIFRMEKKQEEVERRVKYHWKEYEKKRSSPSDNEEKRDARAASTLLASVIDLPGRWIEDLWTGRRIE